MTQTTAGRSASRTLLNKVPEVTVWFWVIKILCTTVGESFADWINMQLGVGLTDTALIFTAVFVVALVAQMRQDRYVPTAYWFTVVVVSVTGTLYTDLLTDQLGVPLWISTTVFSILLAGVFAIWWQRERTLSIHSIVTRPREAFYWLAVLVTFALGTATGDWTLELTGWGPGKSVLLPLGLIAIVTVLWRYGANPVLAFWVAYILTRPLGANIGDWLASPSSEQGLGLGTFVTSLVFLAAILSTVIYLTVSRTDVTEKHHEPTEQQDPAREKRALAALAVVAVATVALLTWADAQPHQSALAEEEGSAPTCSTGAALTDAQATQAAVAHFPSARMDAYRSLTRDTLESVRAGDQAGAQARVTDLETAWDGDEASLRPADCRAWTYVDQQIDPALTAVRASQPDPQSEEASLGQLLTALGAP